MTKQEIIASLRKEYLEEVDGIKEYAKMIEDIAPCDPDGKYRKVLKAIVKDEYEHQHYLMKVLVDMNAFMPPDIVEAMEEVKEVYRRI